MYDVAINGLTPPTYFWVVSKNWKYLYLAEWLGIGIPVLCLIWLVPESPKWLYEKGKYERFRKVMDRIAWVNGKRLGEYKLEAEVTSVDNGDKKVDEEMFIPSLWQMLRTPVILVNMIITVIQWSVISAGFYMIAFYVKYIEGNIFFLNITSNIAVLIGYLTAGFL